MTRAYVLLPELLIGGAALSSFALPRFGPRRVPRLHLAVIIAIALALVAELALGAAVGTLFRGGFRQDRFALMAKAAVLVGALVWTAVSDTEDPAPTLYGVLGAMIAASAGTIPVLWAGTALALAAAVESRRSHDAAGARSLFVVGSILVAGLAVALALVYATSGVSSVADLRVTAAVEPVTAPLAIAILVAAAACLGLAVAAPFDACGTAGAAGLFALLRLLGPLVPVGGAWGTGLAVAGAVALLAGIAALVAARTLREFAFAVAVGQVGWAAAAAATQLPAGFGAALLVATALMVAAAALPAVLAAVSAGDLAALRTRAPHRFVAAVALAVSLAGAPPLAGFVADFAAAAAISRSSVAWLLAPALAFSIAALIAGARLVAVAVLQAPVEEPRGRQARRAPQRQSRVVVAGTWAAAAIPALFLLLANPISSLAQQGAAAITR